MKKTSYAKLVLKQYWAKRLNRVGLLIVLAMFAIALFAPFLANDKPYYAVVDGKAYYPILTEIFPFKNFIRYPELNEINWRTSADSKIQVRYLPPIPYSPTEYDLDVPLLAPEHHHWLGTDDQGRDVLARLIHGARVSLSVGFVAVAIYVALGVIIGAIAGYYGGKVDMVISRVIEIVMCFPTFFLILAVLAFIGPSLYNIMLVIGITSWTGIARLVRGEFLRLRNQDFVAGIVAAGAKPARVIFRHILPNAMAPVLVSASFGVASAVLVESSLSFLGFGVQPPTPSWGEILSQAHDFMDIAWWLTLFPGVTIFLTITAFNLVGEGLRDAIDPKM